MLRVCAICTMIATVAALALLPETLDLKEVVMDAEADVMTVQLNNCEDEIRILEEAEPAKAAWSECKRVKLDKP
jgi:hypothetical protein